MIIKGDLNGDGKITIEDYIILRSLLLEGDQPQGDILVAADVNNDGEVSVTDYIILNSHLSGTSVLTEVVE